MVIYGWVLCAWAALLVASWPYAERTRHPAVPQVAAWLVLVATFSAMAPVLFGLLTAMAPVTGPVAPLGLLALAFLPGLLLGGWLITRPLRRMPLPGE